MSRTQSDYRNIKNNTLTGASFVSQLNIFDETRSYLIDDTCWWGGYIYKATANMAGLDEGDISMSPTGGGSWIVTTEAQNIHNRVSNTQQLMTLATQTVLYQTESIYSGGFADYSNGVFTFNRNGIFVIDIAMGFNDPAGNRREIVTRINHNGTVIDNLYIPVYTRGTADAAIGGGSQQCALPVSIGQTLEVECTVVDGANINTIPEACSINIFIPGGEQGIQGEKGDIGELVWVGDYATGSYDDNEVVRYNNNIFVCRANGTITNPGTPSSPNTGWDLVMAAPTATGDGVQPYLLAQPDTVFPINAVGVTYTLIGGNFDNNMSIDMGPELTITSLTATSDIEAEVVFNTSNTIQTDFFAVLSRGSLNHFGGSFKISTGEIIGTGSAGTFTTNFNHATGNTNGNALWGANWDLWIDTGVNSLDGLFQDSNNTTGSGGTGPNAAHDSYYMFTERSSPNFDGTDKDATATTSNFRDADSIQFWYHMFGTDMGDLILQAQDGGNNWNTVQTWSGPQQAAQGDPFLDSGVISLTAYAPKAIRFLFTTPVGYTSDVALDDIIIISS